jgi:putative redox protein
MSLRASAHAVPGTLRQTVLVNGRHRLITDQPEQHGGGDLGPSPHELLPAALAACTAWALASYARTKQWDLGDVTVDVDYDHRSEPRRLDTIIRLGGDLSPSQVERLHRAAAACPLRRSLETGFTFDERIELTPRAA